MDTANFSKNGENKILPRRKVIKREASKNTIIVFDRYQVLESLIPLEVSSINSSALFYGKALSHHKSLQMMSNDTLENQSSSLLILKFIREREDYLRYSKKSVNNIMISETRSEIIQQYLCHVIETIELTNEIYVEGVSLKNMPYCIIFQGYNFNLLDSSITLERDIWSWDNIQGQMYNWSKQLTRSSTKNRTLLDAKNSMEVLLQTIDNESAHKKKKIFKELVLALKHIHSLSLVHGHLNTRTVLCNTNYDVKLFTGCDNISYYDNFGLKKTGESLIASSFSTAYCPPEYIYAQIKDKDIILETFNGDSKRKKYDFYLSYRNGTDSDEIKEIVYEKLKDKFKVYNYKWTATVGEDFRVEQMNALIQSKYILIFVSRSSINPSDKNWRSFSNLNKDSNRDFFFLEQRISLELQALGLIDKQCIFPIYIGDMKDNNKRGNYFNDHCYPDILGDVIVSSIEFHVKEYFDLLDITPLNNYKTVKNVVKSIHDCKGFHWEGSLDDSIDNFLKRISEITISLSDNISDSDTLTYKFKNSTSVSDPHLYAHSSFDIWSLGCILYFLNTGSKLFETSSEKLENIRNEQDLKDLFEWDDRRRYSKLSNITDRYARNLLSLLLQENPKSRLTADGILNHPYITSQQVSRLPGEDGNFDICISYRIDNELPIAIKIYQELTKRGLKVFIDCVSVNKDNREGAEGETIKYLYQSNCVVFLISNDSISRFATLNESSQKDSFLFECTTALELKKAGMINAIIPVLIGPRNEIGEYQQFDNWDFSHFPDIVVKDIDDLLYEDLSCVGILKSMSSKLTIRKVIGAVVAHQGLLIKGFLDTAMDYICTELTDLYCNRTLDKFIIDCVIKDINPMSEILRKSDLDGSDLFVFRYIYFSILSVNLPIKIEKYDNKIRSFSQIHNYAFSEAVQKENDTTIFVIEKVLKECTTDLDSIIKLANSLDKSGRKCLNIATEPVRRLINNFLFLNKRYELKAGAPEHISATCVIRLAKDHFISGISEEDSLFVRNGTTNTVALKFMNSYQGFLCEVNSRNQGNFDEHYVLRIFDYFDQNNIDFRNDAILKGFENYPYCVTMPAADENLKKIIDQQHIVGKDWDAIKHIIKSITLALNHLHDKDYIHGDLKPMNVMKIKDTYKLIDFDACVNFKKDEFAGAKYSSAYSAPEFVYSTSHNGITKFGLRTFDRSDVIVTKERSYELLRAQPSYDIWGLGCILYLLCTGSTLFQATVEDNLSNERDLEELYKWNRETKLQKISKVTDRYARNLLSLLLHEHPTNRLTSNRILMHPFLTGKPIEARLQGEDPEYDVFLSYRVASQKHLASVFYTSLIKRGLKVFLDQECLIDGKPWEDGFVIGLLKSASYVCLLSSDAINNNEPSKIRQDFSRLTENSLCDNFLLELRFALELSCKERGGMLNNILPVFVGNCPKPNSPSIIVHDLEKKFLAHLDNSGLGDCFTTNMTVKKIVDDIYAYQGAFLQHEDHAEGLETVFNKIKNMCTSEK